MKLVYSLPLSNKVIQFTIGRFIDNAYEFIFRFTVIRTLLLIHGSHLRIQQLRRTPE